MNHDDLDVRLTRHLREAAGRVHPGVGDPSRPVAMARRHRRRRHRATAIGTAGALAVLSVGAYRVVDGDGSTRDVSIPAAQVSAGEVASTLQWTAGPAPLGLGYASVVRDGSNLYALSTEPGSASTDGPVPQALYRSTDGSTWQSTTLGGDVRLMSVAASAGTVYAVGTAPAVRSSDPKATDLVVVSSTDGGVTWNRGTVPLDVAGLRERLGGGFGLVARVAAGDHGVSVLVSADFVPDVAALLPAGVDSSWGTHPTATGIAVSGRPDDAASAKTDRCPGTLEVTEAVNSAGGHFRCTMPTSPSVLGASGANAIDVVLPAKANGSEPFDLGPGAVEGPQVAFYGWDQLGVSPDVAALLAQQPLAYWSADGREFQRAQLPSVGDSLSLYGVVSFDGGFVAALTRTSGEALGTVVLRSADGRSWTATDGVGSDGYPVGLGVAGDRVMLVTNGEAGAAVASSFDGRSWLPVDLAGLLSASNGATAFVDAAGFGPLGVVLSARVDVDPVAVAGGVKRTHGDVTVRITSLAGEIDVTTASGQLIATLRDLGSPSNERIRLDGTGGFEVLGEDGSVAATFTASDVTAMWADVKNMASAPVDAQPKYLVHSTDGQSWSRSNLDTLAGQATVSVRSVVVTAERVVVNVALEPPSDTDPYARNSLLLVGTPK